SAESHLVSDARAVVPTSVEVFFFQAEDGIRDRNVTGVQTCALPIYQHDNDPLEQLHALCRRPVRQFSVDAVERLQLTSDADVPRSEERRVGKECRPRWWRDQGKKKVKSAGGVVAGTPLIILGTLQDV